METTQTPPWWYGNASSYENPEIVESPLQKAKGAAVLGRAEFVEEITAKHVGRRGPEREVPALRQFSKRPLPEDILKEVDATIRPNKRLARQAGMYFCHRFSGAKVREIGEMFSVGSSAITEASRLFSKRLETDEELAEVVEKIKGELNI